MPHCENCGEAVVEDGASGAWVHEASPDALDPAWCVLGTSEGTAYGLSDSIAVLCTDKDCPDPLGTPWWKENVRK